MNRLNRPLKLNPETEAMLKGIESGKDKCLIYGADTATAEARVKAIVMPLLEGSGLRHIVALEYWWFLRELCRLFRTRTGRDLAFNLELVIRKWVPFGLEPNTMQLLLAEVYTKLRAGEGHDRNGRHFGSCPKPDATGIVSQGSTGNSGRVPSAGDSQ